MRKIFPAAALAIVNAKQIRARIDEVLFFKYLLGSYLCAERTDLSNEKFRGL